MINSSILDLVLNKYVLGSFGVLISLIYVYFKGSKSAKDAAEKAALEVERALSSRLRAAEAKNQHIEKQGATKNETINSANTMDELLRLWDKDQPK